jgi:hypothetical protein
MPAVHPASCHHCQPRRSSLPDPCQYDDDPVTTVSLPRGQLTHISQAGETTPEAD